MRILTFDVEEWFHILDNESTKTEAEWNRYERRLEMNMDRILELLASKQLKATFFCLGWVAREFPHVIRCIAEHGHEIATHSDLHQLVYEQQREVFREDLRRSVNEIEDITGTKVTTYRAPGFSLMKEDIWVFEELVAHGIEVDCSVFPASRGHGGFSSFGAARPVWVEAGGVRLKEFPINLFPVAGRQIVFSGGGYFRLIPYWLIAYMMHQSRYVMTYFHPRDFDASQPVIDELSFVRRFKSYYGLRGAFRKLDRLLSDFEFSDLASANTAYDWGRADVIAL
ncbi:polysaccharide deacetylase family protein [Prosthecochloris sp. HL-130-GSB]|uniref:polysaccharide deacetylase family protein n=1 Tax=Prosthecochloris sp. HL-130-GSB TaxID=1974213 RepID=UPI000A1C1490|nr:polysaccharide deacetylase family protein [Prosthecochloris sp. HL-130-GSB]ARM31347.1 polysaccharide deacetylase [Prosthecochloris sp. HL-130-GSB]